MSYQSSNLFVVDKRSYCCGPQAARQRFAQKWERLKITDYTRKGAEFFVQRIYDETGLLPFKLEASDSLTLVWSGKSHNISLYVDCSNDFLNTLFVDDEYTEEVLADKMIDLLR